ncbi:fatty acyl-coa reductase [Plakobranchus ocellatus]|uniref:Fatty acyl-CoA reductase n=1 Tax=Plakobranchus ocellatus TaxID=259542 RepID=A0AAV4E2Y1_9GAST|nr:fatty acyl-coa reductase [Plakobranchus ocellatus]
MSSKVACLPDPPIIGASAKLKRQQQQQLQQQHSLNNNSAQHLNNSINASLSNSNSASYTSTATNTMSEEISALASPSTGVASFYRNKTILLTGVTGFMGKVLLEKLLRSCPGIRRCYALVRPKKGQTPQERMESILSSKLYSKLREAMPDLRSRIVPVCGDILEPRLGLSEQDEAMIVADTNIVFHSAATVKFDEELKLSVQMNVIGVRRMVQLARKMEHLQAFIHVSTAYANCDKESVKEVVYDPPLHPNKLIDAVEWMDADAIQALTSKLIGSRPNTYTYTKALAEYLLVEESKGLPVAIVRPSIVGASWSEPVPGWVDNLNGPTGLLVAALAEYLLVEESKGLPVAIVRPSIVGASWSEPVPGWVDNLNGPTGLLVAIGKGLLFIMHGDGYCTADVIPVDTATNAMIAVAWYTAIERPRDVLIYNVTSGQINRFTWGAMAEQLRENFIHYPCHNMARVPNPRFTLSMLWRDIMWFIHQLMPAYIFDLSLRVMGKKPMFVKIQDRLSKAVTTLEFFTSNEWTFHNDNIFLLLNRMSEEDKQTFCFDPRSIDWKKYMLNYCLGVKEFVLKEDISQLPAARVALQRLQRIQTLLKVLSGVIIWRLLVKRVPVFHSLWNLLLGWVQFLFTKLPSLARSS